MDVERSVLDCVDCVNWCRKELEGIIGKGRIDADRYAVTGESAGGLMVSMIAEWLVVSGNAVANAS